MVVLQVIGNEPGAGKTSVISALMLGLLPQGKKVSYYKPISSGAGADQDSAFISQTLLNDPPAVPAPLDSSAELPLTEASANAIKAAAANLTGDHDVLLIEGPGESQSAQDVAELVDSKLMLVFRYSTVLEASAVVQVAEAFGQRLVGVLINGFLPHRQREVTEGLVGQLRSQSIPVLGAIPQDRAMLGVTVQQIADHLGGEWVQEPADAEAWVDRFLIGGNIMDSGPNYYGRYSNQAVITRADRPDIQMASLSGDTRCLVLTGGVQPTEYIRVEASKKGVPLILVESDTIGAAESLGELLDQVNPYRLHQARRFEQLMREHVNLASLSSILS